MEYNIALTKDPFVPSTAVCCGVCTHNNVVCYYYCNIASNRFIFCMHNIITIIIAYQKTKCKEIIRRLVVVAYRGCSGRILAFDFVNNFWYEEKRSSCPRRNSVKSRLHTMTHNHRTIV